MIRILSDSTCDLSADLIARHGIAVLPLHVLLGDNEYLDGANITPDEIYRWSDENKTTPKTSAISVLEAKEAVKPLLDQGDEVICFTISSKLSGTYQNLVHAVEELHATDRVRVIDSQNLSTGVGLLVLQAADMIVQGLSLPEIETRLLALVPQVRSRFVVDTLTYLHRGGRCSGLAALAGGALKLHPRIAVSQGSMSAGKKYRGRMQRVLTEYVADMHDDLLQARNDRVFITHSGCDEQTIDLVRAQLEALGHFRDIHVTRAGSVISSHCGPGTLGVLYINKDL